MDYKHFLDSKHVRHERTGFDVPLDRLNQKAFDWQRAVVRWWLAVGRAGGFADCGLGKTLMQLIYAEMLIKCGKARRVLILTPPAVAQQTLAEAAKFGIEVDCRIVRYSRQVDSGINITNYERLHKFNTSLFDVVILDESSILKSYMGKTKQMLLSAFAATPYRLAATATPAPNDHLELGNHAEFLGVMPSNEMISRWFINDTMAAGNYRLRHHAADDFWQWVASWAISVSKPSDLGDAYSDAGYELPPLNLQEHLLYGDGTLFGDTGQKLSATNLHKAKRESAPLRAVKCAELRAGMTGPCVIWCDTNYEADAILAEIPDAVEIRGSHKLDQKEERLLAFSRGEIATLVTKAEIAGFGMNWQHCRNTIFAGLSYSYERFYQALRRFYRFGQTETVNCHILAAGQEASISETVQEKGGKHEAMKSAMTACMKSFQQQNLHGRRTLTAPPKPTLHEGEDYQLWHGDCVEVVRDKIADDSIDFCIHSPPFANLYIYSDSAADMGNAADDEEFFKHYEYLIGELHRVTVPGRICAVHCKDLPKYKGRDGVAGLSDFPGRIIRAFESKGWAFHSRVTIWKCPVIEMQRTKNHGLLHKQLCKDSSASRQGMADYMLMFRKWSGWDGVNPPKPVTGESDQARFDEYYGEQGPQLDEAKYTKLDDEGIKYVPDEERIARQQSIEVWQRYASPVWFDIRQTDVLNYRLGRDEKDEKHICPLQLGVIERCVHLWTNPGDLVLDPFNGIGSSGYVALQMGRRYVGAELKQGYVDLSRKNLDAAKVELAKKQAAEAAQPKLFDLAV